MKVSIILPVYNVEKYVTECLETIKNQSFQDFECLIIEDGSTDNSAEIVKNWMADERFIYLQIPHSGLSVARNKGIELAKGEYIYYCDSDDIMYEDCLLECVKFMDDYKLSMMFLDAETKCDCSNEFQCKSERDYFNKKYSEIIMPGEDFFEYVMFRNKLTLTAYTQMIRKDSIKYLYYPDIYYESDLYTYQNLLLQKRVGHLPKTLYCKRTRDNSILSSKFNYHYFWSTYVIADELEKYSYKHMFNMEVEKQLSRIIHMYYIKARGLYKNLSDEDKLKVTNEMLMKMGL